MMYTLDFKSPIGILEIKGTKDAIYSILFVERDIAIPANTEAVPDLLHDCQRQLEEYFKGERKAFTIPYITEGTDFQRRVWNALTSISYGETGSYKTIATEIEKDKAVRAVGSANSKNKLTIVIPCHRIIGANGKLTGYAGGLWRKEWLLEHEKKNF